MGVKGAALIILKLQFCAKKDDFINDFACKGYSIDMHLQNIILKTKSEFINTRFMKMKILITLLFLPIISYAQVASNGSLFSEGLKFSEARIVFKDGHSENGFIKGFIDKSFTTFNYQTGFETLEKQLNLTDKSFDFKNTEEGVSRKLTNDEIDQITIVHSKAKFSTYQLYGMKTANSKGKIVDLNRKIWLPVIKKGKVNILGFNIVNSNTGRYGETVVYLNRDGEDFAINPIDRNRINLFNLGKIDDKFVATLNEIFKDCPEFLSSINEDPKTFTEQITKRIKENRKEAEKQFKEDSKKLKGNDKKLLEMQIYEQFYISEYVRLIEDYLKFCPN